VEAAECRLPLWMGLACVQASSTKHQASSIKLLGDDAGSNLFLAGSLPKVS
jgi:hypothetical protein